jgi:hypothetical protein
VPEDETTIAPTSDFPVPSSFVTGPGRHDQTTAPGSPHDPPALAGLPKELIDHPRYQVVAAIGAENRIPRHLVGEKLH